MSERLQVVSACVICFILSLGLGFLTGRMLLPLITGAAPPCELMIFALASLIGGVPFIVRGLFDDESDDQ